MNKILHIILVFLFILIILSCASSDDGASTSSNDTATTSNTALVEFNWYGVGRTYFEFSLSNSKEAIKSAKKLCAQ